jgi:hypothetical protein
MVDTLANAEYIIKKMVIKKMDTRGMNIVLSYRDEQGYS